LGAKVFEQLGQQRRVLTPQQAFLQAQLVLMESQLHFMANGLPVVLFTV